MTVRNRASRYHLVMDAINNARRVPSDATELKAWCEQKLGEHEAYVVGDLEDMPEVRDWSLGDWAERADIGRAGMPKRTSRTRATANRHRVGRQCISTATLTTGNASRDIQLCRAIRASGGYLYWHP